MQYWASWYLWFFVEATLVAVTLTATNAIIGSNEFRGTGSPIVFLWLELFCINLCCFAALLSTFVDGKKAAYSVSSCIYLLSFGLPMGLRNFGHQTRFWQRSLMCLLGPTCFSETVIRVTSKSPRDDIWESEDG